MMNKKLLGVLLALMGIKGAVALGAPAPQIVGKELIITCKVKPESLNGVVLAQGGSSNGYALLLREGKPLFIVRLKGTLYTADSPTVATGTFTLEAHLRKDGTMTLAVNDVAVAVGSTPGLFTEQPKEPLDIGKDTRTAVGNYPSPNTLKGKVEDVKVEVTEGDEALD